MAKNRTIEDKLLEGHKERVEGLTALCYHVIKSICGMDIPDNLAYASSKSIVIDWLKTEISEKEDENDANRRTED